ncbi:MAG: leucine-rich repeat domain-containing protein, partial [Mycoplasmataceae bacterium]|nr:leucine-rich repeat domain-containing protein [Mycoplasmataceae bacterium]
QYTKFTNVINHSPSFCLADNVGSAKVLIPASSGTSLDYEYGSVVAKIAFGQITIPFDVTTIGSALFGNCLGLTGSLVISDSVDRIGSGAFSGCSGLTDSLVISDSVDRIEIMAFSGCSGFKIIDISSWTDIPTIRTLSFNGFNADGGTVLVPSNYDELGISISTFPGLPDTWQLQIA